MPHRRDKLIAIITEGGGGVMMDILRGFIGYSRPSLPWRLVTRNPMKEGTEDLVKRLQPDGLLLNTSMQQARKYLALGLPTVLCTGPPANGEQLEMKRVAWSEFNDMAMGEMACEHFVDLELPELAIFGQSWSGAFMRRAQAFHAYAERRGLKVQCFYTDRANPRDINSSRIEEQTDEVMQEWFLSLPKPVGILFSSAGYADHCSDLCRLAGIAIPEEICVLAAEDDPNITELAYPSVSAVYLPFEEVGAQAARQLERMMEGFPPSKLPIIQPKGVKVRASTSFIRFKNSRISQAMAYIRENATHHCTVEDVLEQVQCSRTYLDRVFRQEVGHSVFQEIRRRQVEAARALLSQEGISIAEVAERCGFGSPVRFSTVFKQETGMTPRQFRKEKIFGL